jgi:hypothetical protein
MFRAGKGWIRDGSGVAEGVGREVRRRIMGHGSRRWEDSQEKNSTEEYSNGGRGSRSSGRGRGSEKQGARPLTGSECRMVHRADSAGRSLSFGLRAPGASDTKACFLIQLS